MNADGHLRRLTTPRAAALAGVLFAVLFGAALVLIRTALPEGAQPGTQWIEGAGGRLRVSATLMPFAGISFLWFIAVVRDGFGKYEDRFFSTVFFGSGLLFLATLFAASAVGSGMAASRAGIPDVTVMDEVALFGQGMLHTLATTYGIRMAAVFMMSLATIWLRTGLMPRWLVMTTYLVALGLLLAADTTMWLTLAFPLWVLVVSIVLLVRAGVIDLRHDSADSGPR
ncbi:hypothetical protein L2K20_04745 [Mycobacterium sp. MBM]|nr:hypothetical protein [Mycobacterium sp. MBM]